MPSSPQSISEIIEAFKNLDVMETYGCTLQTVDIDNNPLPKKYTFFDIAIEKSTHSFCVFSSKATIELINQHIPLEERHILMDATFRIVPIGPFKQLLILYIRRHRKV